MSVNLLGADILTSVFYFFRGAFKGINFNIVFGISIGLMVLFVVIASIKTAKCYESKTIKGINKINRYLLQNPAITEENLITFHGYIKKMTKRIRDRWQLYVLERDGLPSRYLTSEYCVRRPLANSVLNSVMKQIKLSAIVLSCITFILGLGYADANLGTTFSLSNLISVLIYALVTPAIIMLLSTLFIMIIKLRQSSMNSKIYEVFNTFVRNVNRAVATMPDSIDYEVLFTKKEIEEGIPVLREYLEKKALEEQQLLEQSKYNAISHSPYQFDDLGVDGQQLISRAVNESESFLMKKLAIQDEMQEFEKKLAQAEANMDEIEKEANRKLQTIKENLERLDKAIAETTNRVEINYNRRQIKDEMEKRAAIEKDLKSLLAKEQVTINECMKEIEKRKELIEKDRSQVEVALKSEYNTFAVKVYDTLSDKVNEENVDTMKEYQQQIVDLKTKIQTLTREVENKDAKIAEKDLEISNYQDKNMKAVLALNGESEQQEQQNTAPEQNLMTAENAQQEEVYYDENGNAIDYSQYYDENGNLIDYSQYYDENGNLIDYSQYYDENGNYIGPTQEEWNQMYGQDGTASTNEGQAQASQEVLDNQQNVVEDNQNLVQEENQKVPQDGQEVVETNETLQEVETIEPQEVAEEIKEETPKIPQEQDVQEISEPEITEDTQPSQKAVALVAPYKSMPVAVISQDEKKEEVKKPKAKTAKKKESGEKLTLKTKATKTKKPKTEKPKAEKSETKKSEAEKLKIEKTAKSTSKKPAKKTETKTKKDDFGELQKQIEEENQKIQKQQYELRIQIDKALNKIETSSSENSKQNHIKKIKSLIEKLKEQAKEAKAKGATKEEIRRINSSVAELVEAITKVSSQK